MEIPQSQNHEQAIIIQHSQFAVFIAQRSRLQQSIYQSHDQIPPTLALHLSEMCTQWHHAGDPHRRAGHSLDGGLKTMGGRSPAVDRDSHTLAE
ncbi:hypothetical protein ACOMHN_011035 [Nucella lapillus]